MKQLSLDGLRTLVTIVDAGGYAKAGDILGRSQPAISLQVKKMEQLLGRSLFRKVGQKYELNKEGIWLYAQAKKMLALNDESFRYMQQESLRGRLRLGIPSEFASRLLPRIVGAFSKLYPDVSLDVTSALSRHLLSAQSKQSFDLVLALFNPDEKTNGEVLIEDDVVWVGDSSQRSNYRDLSLVLAPDGCVYRSRVIQQLKQQTNAWKITYTNADLYGLIAAISQGLGITALARSSVPDELDIIRSPHLPELGKIKICLINQDTQHPQVSKTLSKFIRAHIV